MTDRIAGAAVATPIKSDQSIDLDCLIEHCRTLLAKGLDTLVLFGSTGEGPSFSNRQRIDAISRCAQSGISPQQLGTGVFAQSSADASAQCAEAFENGCGYVLLAPPSYFKGVDDEGLYRWFSESIEGAGHSAAKYVLYHIPGMTQIELSIDLVHRLAKAFPTEVTGVKDSSGNWPHTRQLIEQRGALNILVGHEGYLAQGVAIGAAGSISGTANVIPEVIRATVHDNLQGEQLPELIQALLRFPVIPGVKALIAHRLASPDWANVRAPLTKLNESDIATLGTKLDELFPASS